MNKWFLVVGNISNPIQTTTVQGKPYPTALEYILHNEFIPKLRYGQGVVVTATSIFLSY